MGPTRRSCPSTYSRPRDKSAAEETETEPSERQRRPRGRPRRGGPSPTDHDLGSSRSARADDVPLPTVGEDAIPQMYDDTVPHASEEGAGGSTSSAASKPYKRGPSQLPKRPILVDRRPLIAPEGDR